MKNITRLLFATALAARLTIFTLPLFTTFGMANGYLGCFTSDCDSNGNGNVHGAPGPIAGAGLPILAVGYGVYWLIKLRRNRALTFSDFGGRAGITLERVRRRRMSLDSTGLYYRHYITGSAWEILSRLKCDQPPLATMRFRSSSSQSSAAPPMGHLDSQVLFQSAHIQPRIVWPNRLCGKLRGLDRCNAANGQLNAAAAKPIDNGGCEPMPACLA